MIALNRGSTVPQKIKRDGHKETGLLIQDFHAGKKPEPKNSVYGHDSVKELLRTVQNNKCAFCETKLRQQFGNVEHFRPKKSWQATINGPLIEPGYFWLSYSWENLMLSCEVCNIRYKKNYFPLEDDATRANPTDRDISSEKPLLINPFTTSPSKHLKFDRWNVLPQNNSKEGKASIKGYGLDSNELDECRRDRLKDVELILTELEKTVLPNSGANQAAEFLARSISDAGEYSATVRDNFGDRINEILRRFST